jgi:hypothetical protein
MRTFFDFSLGDEKNVLLCWDEPIYVTELLTLSAIRKKDEVLPFNIRDW